MPHLRTLAVPASASRRAPILAAALLIGGAVTACSAGSPVEPTASRAVAPSGPSRTGYQVGWGISDGADASIQTAGKPVAVAKDSTKTAK